MAAPYPMVQLTDGGHAAIGSGHLSLDQPPRNPGPVRTRPRRQRASVRRGSASPPSGYPLPSPEHAGRSDEATIASYVAGPQPGPLHFTGDGHIDQEMPAIIEPAPA
jgi:hypothetical protein